jgi:hypothetical protein
MGEINWLLTILVGAIISIPFSVLSNFLTPIIQEKMEKSALSTKEKKLTRLQKEFKETKELYDKPHLFSAKVAQKSLGGLSIVMFSLSAIIIVATLEMVKKYYIVSSPPSLTNTQLIFLIFLMIMLLIGGNILSEFLNIVIRLSKYEEYKKDVVTQIKLLKKESKSQKKDI